MRIYSICQFRARRDGDFKEYSPLNYGRPVSQISDCLYPWVWTTMMMLARPNTPLPLPFLCTSPFPLLSSLFTTPHH